MAKPITDRIAILLARKEQLEVDLARAVAKQKSQERKRDTRRKIVVGGAVLAAAEKDPRIAAQLGLILAQMVGRPIDREVIADLLPPPSPTRVAAHHATTATDEATAAA